MDDHNKILSILIQGGIGDFLQYAQFIYDNKINKRIQYIVQTHQKSTLDILNFLGIRPISFEHYNTHSELISLNNKIINLENTYLCPRSIYFTNSPFINPLVKPNFRRPILGMHLWGSKYSSDTAITFGTETKNIPHELLYEIAKSEIQIFLFGTKEEISTITDIHLHKNITPIHNSNLVESLKKVLSCDLVIASDSSIKTMSSMHKIPTLTIIPDIKDEFRDENFIAPYVQDSIMEIFKFKNLNNPESVNLLINASKKFVEKFLQRKNHD